MLEILLLPARLGPALVMLSLLACAGPVPDPRASEPAPPAEEPQSGDIGRFFPPPEAELLLLGTFHFKDAGLDGYKPQFDVDILSAERQREVAELVDRLAAWRPTRIAVEWDADEQTALDERYASFLAGEFELESNEIYQVAFRLGAQLGHERLWAVDADARWYEPWVDPDEWAAANGLGDELDPGWDEAYTAWYTAEDEAKTGRTLREQLLTMNREDYLRQMHGHYLVGSFEATNGVDYPGADGRTSWYNRNLRIFANILRTLEAPGERIFVLIGAGHVPILRHAAQASPEIELVEVGEVL